jgi:Domain of unknown function(DUF2779)
MSGVSKDVFLASIECPGMAWLLRTSEKNVAPSEAAKLRMDEGREVGQLAREVYAGGSFVPATKAARPADATAALLATEVPDILYEATFEADGLVARADILQRTADGWRVLEVKSGTNDTPERVTDLAYTAAVARRAGLPVTEAALVLLSKEYRLGMPRTALFVEIDHTPEVDALVPRLLSHWESVASLVLGERRPTADLAFACRKCPYYADACIGEGIDDPLFDLPRLSASKFAALKELGVTCIAEIPAAFTLTDNQARVRDAVVSGNTWASPRLKDALDRVRWPAFYLDFETTATAVPIFPGIAPTEQFPTQYSIHVYADIDTEVAHREFLADHRVDDRRRLAERLLADLDGAGSIVVYTGFEQRFLHYLAGRFPDLAARFAGCVERLVDLEKIVRENVYHPEFRGRSSIKRVLPTLVPDMTYDDLPIGDGGEALALFARMARGQKTEEECAEIRTNLLRYCKQDTLGMVRVHQALARQVA